MAVAIIGAMALVASVGSWFLPGIALAIGLIALGLLLDFGPWGSR